MSEIKQSDRCQQLINKTIDCCKLYRHEFVMPEHLLRMLCDDYVFKDAVNTYGSAKMLRKQVEVKLQETFSVPEQMEYVPETSVQLLDLFGYAVAQVESSSATCLDIPHLVNGLLQLPDSWASYLLKKAIDNETAGMMSELVHGYKSFDEIAEICSPTDDEEDGFFDDKEEGMDDEFPYESNWRKFVTCLNNTYQNHNPLIGREQELERTVQVLCRKQKNNPLHIGDPGVGKTALVYGLAQRIVEGRVPKRLKDSRIYQLDLGTLLAGTQFRGDFENRLKQIMEGISGESDTNIVYIDEIHNLVGAGAVGESSMDASNMLKPYLESGRIRFIGSTTYEEYNKYFSRSRGLVRRFQQIDIQEPSVENTVHILKQLRQIYEDYHGVVYDDDALELAVTASAKHISDRFLPDKAIDLIDEAGAMLEIAQNANDINQCKGNHVTTSLIADVLAKICKVEALSVKEDDSERLMALDTQLSSKIFGQDEAIRQVTEAVQLSKAGLTDDDKPLASLLFVGPTGVGKTEVARVLARQLGIELVRFDMSEYTEKHTVAKLIGSPAGYVGYEDGGLLTDAIRKTPNCVLLLDEIEKAHQDIYNILLQVMDYARLTDNKGRKADFRNVILIMTSNAGAQYAGQASIGFSTIVSRGEAMLRQVKKTFKPEFLNRLSATVVFRDMDREMATLILRKKLGELQEKLKVKNVEMTLTDEVFEALLSEGFTREYGAREMDRVIAQRLKPLLMREILFGSLKEGGNITIDKL